MKLHTKILLAAAAAAFAGTVNAQRSESIYVVADDTPVFVKTEGMPSYLARRVEAEAAKGLQPLRQYVQNTKFIHQLDLVSILLTEKEAKLARAENPNIQLAAIGR